MHGKIKLKLENENYRDESARLKLYEWRERTKTIKVKVYKQKLLYQWKVRNVYKNKKTNEKYVNEKKVYDWKNVY